jgi:hypothetical protein
MRKGSEKGLDSQEKQKGATKYVRALDTFVEDCLTFVGRSQLCRLEKELVMTTSST